MYSIKEFCKFVGISVALYYVLRNRGEGPAETRISSRVLISKDTANLWLKSREVPAKAA